MPLVSNITDVRILSSSNTPIEELTRELVNNHLYNEYGSMYGWVQKWSNVKDIFLAKYEDRYIGALVLLYKPVKEWPDEYINIGVFVLPSWRQNHVGSKLIAAARAKYPSYQMMPWMHTGTSEGFYKSVGFAVNAGKSP